MRKTSGHSGQGLSSFRLSAGFGRISNAVTLFAPFMIFIGQMQKNSRKETSLVHCILLRIFYLTYVRAILLLSKKPRYNNFNRIHFEKPHRFLKLQKISKHGWKCHFSEIIRMSDYFNCVGSHAGFLWNSSTSNQSVRCSDAVCCRITATKNDDSLLLRVQSLPWLLLNGTSTLRNNNSPSNETLEEASIKCTRDMYTYTYVHIPS